MHIKPRKNSKLVFVILLFLLFSCSKTEEENYAVKVGDSYLTESMIEESLNFNGAAHKFREEFIREWIETELIYLDALENKIIYSEEYKRLLAIAKVEIANALAVKKIISDNSIKIENEELENFYVNNISEFKVSSSRFVYNQVNFYNRKYASEFRKMVIKIGWKNSINNLVSREIKFSGVESKIDYAYNMFNLNLRNQLSKLSEGQISGLITNSKNSFAVVQLLKRYTKDDVPEFEEIKDEIEQKYFSFKRKDLYNNYLKELYSKYNFEIVR